MGYTEGEINEILVRIYREQSGGGPLVQQDRKQRRERLRMILVRLRNDETADGDMRRMAVSTLLSLEQVS